MSDQQSDQITIPTKRLVVLNREPDWADYAPRIGDTGYLAESWGDHSHGWIIDLAVNRRLPDTNRDGSAHRHLGRYQVTETTTQTTTLTHLDYPERT